MKFRTFFMLTGAIIVLMAGFFIFQGYTSMEDECTPSVFAGGCYDSMDSWCSSKGGELMGYSLFGSFCDSGVCYSIWDFYCEIGGVQKPFSMPCADTDAFGCYSN